MGLYAIGGAASTGKTTLMTALEAPVSAFAKEAGIKVSFQAERAREVFLAEYSERYDSFQDMLENEAIAYQKRLAEIFYEDAFLNREKNELVIADRSGFDVMVYTLVLISKGYRDLPSEKTIFSLLRSSLQQVSKIFMTTPVCALEDDGFRPSTYAEPETRALEENLFAGIGGAFQNTIWLPETTEDRVKVVMANIMADYM